MSRQSPCYGCGERRVGCHDPAVCPRWASFQEAVREDQAAAEARKATFIEMEDYLRGRRKRR